MKKTLRIGKNRKNELQNKATNFYEKSATNSAKKLVTNTAAYLTI